MIYLYSIASVLFVSIISLAIVSVISLKESLFRKYIFVVVSLAVGALLGDALIHLLPEAFEMMQNPVNVSLSVICGIFIFFIFEKVLHFHHEDCFHDEAPHPIGRLILISDGVHNFIDGIVIGASFLVSVPVGIATTIAVILHEVPQEVGDFGILLHSGYTKNRALWLNFLSGFTALLGLLVVFFLQEFAGTLIQWLLPITAGGFIYVAMSDLIPELHKNKTLKHSFLQVLAIALGVASMLLLLKLE